MYYLIAIINTGENERIFRILDTESKSTLERTESQLIDYIKNQGINIENLGLDEDNKLVGTQGSLERYAKLGVMTEVRAKYPIIVINKTSKGYTVADCEGHCIEMGERELIIYEKQYGVANAKVVTKGKTRFISAISGTFEIVDGKMSDKLKFQWDRLQALKIEGKLSEKSAKKLEMIEEEYTMAMERLRKSELRNKMNGVFDVARMYGIINKIADIMDEVDIDRVEDMQKRVQAQYKSVKETLKVRKNSLSKEMKDKYGKAMKVIGRELKNTIRYVEEEEVSSDECIRKFEVIAKHLAKLNASLK